MFRRPEPPQATFPIGKVQRKGRNAKGEKFVESYRIEELMGEGTFGKVKACTDTRTGRRLAVKIYRKLMLQRRKDYLPAGPGGGGMRVVTHLDKVYRELDTLNKLDHVHCVKLVEVLEHEGTNKLYAVQELCPLGPTMRVDPKTKTFAPPTQKIDRHISPQQQDGEGLCAPPDCEEGCEALLGGQEGPEQQQEGRVRECVRPPLPPHALVPESVAKCFIRDAASALSYLHGTLRVAHRDIKPENLLLDEEGRVKLADFSVSSPLDARGYVQRTEGTYHFQPPEACRTLEEGETYIGHDGCAADVWALGCTLYCYVYGMPPFDAPLLKDLLDLIARSKGSVKLPDTPHISDELCDLLGRMLQSDPKQRATVSDVLAHEWVASADPTCLCVYVARIKERMEEEEREEREERAAQALGGGGVGGDACVSDGCSSDD
eukprot:GDKI01004382.1.p1 GENE.GDKI01004382.1~~GDKI01004382.1.p1  ORF type:complete len:433 (-),score=134.44 GDKI01004382.1:119-1417(-)